jgi:hypothetical protein
MYTIPIIVISVIFILWLLPKQKTKLSSSIVEKDTEDKNIEILKFSNLEVEAEFDFSKYEEIANSPIAVDNSNNTDFFYKVYEECNDEYNENTQYSKEYIFNNGSFLQRKYDAADWYRRRNDTVKNKKELFIKSLEFTKDEFVEIKFGVSLTLVKCFANGSQKEFLLIDSNGIENLENRYFEGTALDNAGFNKSDSTLNLPIKPIDKKIFIPISTRIIKNEELISENKTITTEAVNKETKITQQHYYIVKEIIKNKTNNDIHAINEYEFVNENLYTSKAEARLFYNGKISNCSEEEHFIFEYELHIVNNIFFDAGIYSFINNPTTHHIKTYLLMANKKRAEADGRNFESFALREASQKMIHKKDDNNTSGYFGTKNSFLDGNFKD